MKRIAVLILALALMLTGSALAVYDPAASTPTMWDGEVTTITFTSRLPNIVLETTPCSSAWRKPSAFVWKSACWMPRSTTP